MGKRLKVLRQRKGLTQDQLAERVSLSPKYISGIERGAENPTMDNLLRVAWAVDAEPYELFLYGESEDQEKVVRKGIERLLREADLHTLQLYFEVLRSVMASRAGGKG